MILYLCLLTISKAHRGYTFGGSHLQRPLDAAAFRKVLVWALVGTGVDMSAANFDTAIKETLEDVSEVPCWWREMQLMGSLLVVNGSYT